MGRSGGEFTLLPGDGLSSMLLPYGADASNVVQNGTIQSFCMEHGEYIYSNTTHSVTLSGGAILGGVGSYDPLSIGAAWLYYQFAKGTLAGYNYLAGTDAEIAARKDSAIALQNTLWWLEGEATDPGAGNLFRNAVLTAFGSAANAMADNNFNLYPVLVANLWENGHTGDMNFLRQDVLVLATPIPGAFFLLGTGLIGLVGIRRRMWA